MKEKKARLIMVISMTVFGTIGIFVRQIDLPPQEIVLFRVLFGLAAILLFFIFTKRKFDTSFLKVETYVGNRRADPDRAETDPDRADADTDSADADLNVAVHDVYRAAKRERNMTILYIVMAGAGLAGGWLCFFTSYTYTTVAIATLCNYFEPCIVMIASIFLFKEKVTGSRLICFLLSTVGLVLVVLGGGSASGSPDLFRGVVFGLMSAVFYSFTVICTKQVRSVSGLEMTICQLIVTGSILLPYTLFTCGIHLGQLPLKGILCLVIIGVVHTGIIYSTYITSMGPLKTQEVAVLAYLDPTFSVLSSVFILREPINLLEIVGAVMILGFMVLNELKAGPPKIPDKPKH